MDRSIEKKRPTFLFRNGKIVPYEEATVHVLNTAVKFAAVVFEGMRAYWNDEQEELYIFRLDDHLRRLFRSMKLTRMESPYTIDEYRTHLLELIRRNELREDLHMRIQVLVEADDGSLATTGPIGVAMATMPMGRYTEKDGEHVCVSSWVRIAENSLPPRIKTIANYHNSRLALLQAKVDGYDDAILLDGHGKVTEGPGYSFFLVRDGVPLTCPATSGVLEGITRATIIDLFSSLHDIQVIERPIDKTELYVGDEAFFCGSGAEVMPVLSIDRHSLGQGMPGPITNTIRETYFDLVRGRLSYGKDWLTPVYSSVRSHSLV